jgi:hypothetical protein
MPSKEYYEGRDMEKNKFLHEHLINFFKFDKIDSDGSTQTKTDVIGIKNGQKICLSVKNASGKNTQVHLTTLKKLTSDLNIPNNIVSKLILWFGTNDMNEFELLSSGKKLSKYEMGHSRLSSNNIRDWDKVPEWFNANNRKITSLLIQSLNNGEKSKFLVWNNKVKKSLQIIDIPKLIDFIEKECIWITMPSGTILRCVTPNNKAILWLQMKGNHTDEGYNRCPQFHLVENWPEEIVLSKQIVAL